jgi:hypothetical protein
VSKRWIVILGLLALVIITAFLTGRPRRDDAGPDGILALRRFLDRMGLEVIEAEDPPREGTFFLPSDFRGENEANRLLDWAREGGKLVVGSPYSRIADQLSIDALPGSPGSYGTTLERSPMCIIPETAGVTRVAVRGSDFNLRSPSPNAVSCFNESNRSYVTRVRTGRGEVVVLGGMSSMINANLSRVDNALFAHQLLASEGPVVFGPPIGSGTAPRGVWAALPTPAKFVVIQLGFAFLIFALVRGRRLGRPVTEEPASPIPAGELVNARADLLRQARTTSFTIGLLQKRAARRLAKRIGVSSEVDVETLARLVGRSSAESERLKRLLESPVPESDEALVEMARELEEEVRSLEKISR